MAASAAAHFWFAEIGCVTVDAEYHVTFGIREDGIGMGGDIVEEVMGSLHGVVSGCGLAEVRELRATKMVASTARP